MSGLLKDLLRKAGFAYRLAVESLPDRVGVWLRPRARRFSLAEVPPPVTAPAGEVRLYVAPANFASQGYSWARAAERLPGVGAVNNPSHAAKS